MDIINVGDVYLFDGTEFWTVTEVNTNDSVLTRKSTGERRRIPNAVIGKADFNKRYVFKWNEGSPGVIQKSKGNDDERRI